MLDGDLANVGRAYESTDRTFLLSTKEVQGYLFLSLATGKRNEVAHAQYASQLRQSRTDPLATAQTMLSAFLLDQMLTSESGSSLFLSIWSRLRTDCNEIFHWLKNPAQFVSAHPTWFSTFRVTEHPIFLRPFPLLSRATPKMAVRYSPRWRAPLMFMQPGSILPSTQHMQQNAAMPDERPSYDDLF